jgi:hypothetical protein
VDVTALAERHVEPASTARLRALIATARAEMTASQRAAMERDHVSAGFDGAIVRELRAGVLDLETWRRHAARLSSKEPAGFDARPDALAALIAGAPERPAVASALVWQAIGSAHPALAAHVVQVIRERAELPGLRARLAADEPAGSLVDWFADRQLEDAAGWIEHVPAPEAPTLAAAIAQNEERRAGAARIAHEQIVPFLQRAASFVLALAQRGVDPLGFPLAREAELQVDLPLAQRLELAGWGRAAGRTLCLRGQLRVLRIAIAAPWPLALELINAELGHGGCGGGALLVRLAGAAPVRAATAPVMLCLPAEPIEELGPRFERWLARAYPAAVEAWRPWT